MFYAVKVFRNCATLNTKLSALNTKVLQCYKLGKYSDVVLYIGWRFS